MPQRYLSTRDSSCEVTMKQEVSGGALEIFFPSRLSLSYIPNLSTRIKNGSCLTETRCGWTIHTQKKIGKKILDYWCKREKGGGIPFNLSPMDFISSVCVVGSAKTSNEVELLRALSPTNSRYCCCCTHRVGTKKNHFNSYHQKILSSFDFKELASISAYFFSISSMSKRTWRLKSVFRYFILQFIAVRFWGPC